MDRCTHAEWDKQKGVPFENPVVESDLSNGTSTEENRKIASPGKIMGAPIDKTKLMKNHSYSRVLKCFDSAYFKFVPLKIHKFDPEI